MERRNFFVYILLGIFAFITGYTVKREGKTVVIQRVDSDTVIGKNGKSITDEISILTGSVTIVESYPKKFPELDDTARIIRAISDTREYGTVKFEGGKTYRISSTIEFGQHHIDATGATFVYTGNDSVAIRIGKQNDYVSKIRVRGLYVKNKAIDWNSNITGIQILNVSYCDIELGVENFKTGITVKGDVLGCVYNKFYPIKVYNNKTSLLFRAVNGGWANENIVFGGSFGWSSEQDTSTNVHVEIEYIAYKNNNNKFYGCSFEDGNPTNQISLSYAARVNGTHNAFHDCRYEGATKIYVGKNGKYNIFANGIGFDIANIDGDTDAINTCTIQSRDGLILNGSTSSPTLEVTNINSINNKVINVKNITKTADIFYVQGDGSLYTSKSVHTSALNLHSKNLGVFTGTGNPEAVQTASGGSLYLDRTNGYVYTKKFSGNRNWRMVQEVFASPTAYRPTNVPIGFQYYDTTLRKPVWWDGSTWKDSAGDSV